MLLIYIILVVWGCGVNMYIVPLFLIIFVAKRIFDSKNPYLNPNTKYTAATKHSPATMWFHFTCM